MATVAALDGCRTVGIAFEDSLIGNEYLRTTRVACDESALRITAEVPIPQVQSEKRTAMAILAADKPDAIMHVGFGLGIPGIDDALREIGWMPPRYTTTAFEFAAVGMAPVRLNPDRITVEFNGFAVFTNGVGAPGARDVDLSGADIALTVDLGVGGGRATIRTTDLSHGYVEENSAYSS